MRVNALSKKFPYGRISHVTPFLLVYVRVKFVVVIVDRVFPLCMISFSSL